MKSKKPYAGSQRTEPPAAAIVTRHGAISIARRTAIMGILNVTPDSFYDGGRHLDVKKAMAAALSMVEEGADVIDIGGESTRPGAAPVPAEEELGRVLPIIRALRRASSVPISVDTYKAQVAEAALAEGADIVNDISALRFDPRMVEVAAANETPIVLMHMKGSPRTMQKDARYDDVVSEVRDFLEGRVRFAVKRGIPRDRIVIDPGIGFGKTLEHNLALLRGLPALTDLCQPVLVGASRKAFIGRILQAMPDERLEGSVAAAVAAVLGGARIIRAHDVKQTANAVRIADAVRYGATVEA